MRIHLANHSDLPQQRWAVVPIPVSAEEYLPPNCEGGVVDGHGWRWAKGPRLGDHTRLLYVQASLAPFPATEVVDISRLIASPVGKFRLSTWISDDWDKLAVRVGIDDQVVTVPVVNIEHFGETMKRAYLRAHAVGWHAEFWADVWTDQDAIDFRGRIWWSDETSPNWCVDDEHEITVETGEELVRLFQRHRDEIGDTDRSIQVHYGKIPHGFCFPVRATILCRRDSGQEMPGEDLRLLNLEAARSGPITGNFESWHDSWLVFSVTPENTQPMWQGLAQRFHDYAKGQGALLEQRPLANVLVTGNAGSQGVFGATKDIVAADGSPWRPLELLYNADDYLMRGIHHTLVDGRDASAELRPRMETWSGSPERNSADRFGKSQTQPSGWDKVDGRGVLVDDQHRGDGYIHAAYALTGCPLLLAGLRSHLRTDEMRAKAKRGQLDSPRAHGRLFQSWAKSWKLIPEERARIDRMTNRDLDLLGAKWTSQAGQQVRWLQTVTATSVLQDASGRAIPAAMPWHEALFLIGLLEQIRNDQETFIYKATLAGEIADTILTYGVVRFGNGWLPLNGVRVNADGSANDAAYYTYPREEANQSPVPGTDMLVGTMGWWWWFSGAVACQLWFGQEGGPARECAQWVAANVLANPRSINEAEWAAIALPIGDEA